MDKRTIEITAASLDDARKRAKSEIPEGFSLLSEEVDSDGKPRTLTGIGEDHDEASKSAERKVPAGASVVETRLVSAVSTRDLRIQASDEEAAKSQAKRKLTDGATVEDIAFVAKGSNGFLGIGRTPNTYKVRILQRAVVEITYKEKARIRVTIGPNCASTAARILVRVDRSLVAQLQQGEKTDLTMLIAASAYANGPGKADHFCVDQREYSPKLSASGKEAIGEVRIWQTSGGGLVLSKGAASPEAGATCKGNSCCRACQYTPASTSVPAPCRPVAGPEGRSRRIASQSTARKATVPSPMPNCKA